MKRFGLVGIATALVVALGTAVLAAPITPQTRLGAFNAPGFGGAYGFVFGNATSGFAGSGKFGADFGGPALLDSIRLTQFVDANRHRPNQVEVINDMGQSWLVNFADTQATQTVNLAAANGGQPLPGTYFHFLVRSQHTTGSGDQNFGVMNYTFDGTFVGPAEANNANVGLVPVTTGALGGFNFPARTTDEIIDSIDNTSRATFWVKDAGQDTLTVSYASPKYIEGIGLGFDSGNIGRVTPKFITLTAGAQSEIITLDPNLLQYNRYKLSSPFQGVTSLTITFPDGASAGDWYAGGDVNYGVTEFEAFTPEPGAAGALCVVGIAALRRRRRA